MLSFLSDVSNNKNNECGVTFLNMQLMVNYRKLLLFLCDLVQERCHQCYQEQSWMMA